MSCVISKYNNYNNALSWGAHCAHLWLVCDITTLLQSYFTNTNTTRDNSATIATGTRRQFIQSKQWMQKSAQWLPATCRTRNSGQQFYGVNQGWSCHPINSVKALKETESTEQNQWNHHLTSSCLHPPPDSGVESDVDRVELFQLTLRFFNDVSMAS